MTRCRVNSFCYQIVRNPFGEMKQFDFLDEWLSTPRSFSLKEIASSQVAVQQGPMSVAVEGMFGDSPGAFKEGFSHTTGHE